MRLFGDHAQRLDTPVLPETFFHGHAGLPAPDIDGAEQTLDVLGWRVDRDGHRSRTDGSVLRLPLTVLDDPGQQAIAAEIARQWRMIGVDVPIEAVRREELARRIAERRFTLVLQTWSAAGADPDAFALWHSSQRDHGANAAGLVDAENDRLLVAGRATPDPDARARIYAAWEQRWTTLIPSLPLFQPLLVYDLDRRISPVGLGRQQMIETRSARFGAISDWTARAP